MDKTTLAMLGLVVTAPLPALAAEAPEAPVEVATTQRVALAPGGTVRIDETWGEVTVEAWDQPAVEVRMIRRSARPQPADKAADMRARLEGFTARVEARDGNRVEIVGLEPRATARNPLSGKTAVRLTYVIHVPRDAKLDLDNGAGTVRIAGVTGDIAVDSDVGEVTLAVPVDDATAIEAKSGIGDIDVPAALESRGELKRTMLVGQRYRYQPAQTARRITVTLGVGSITIG